MSGRSNFQYIIMLKDFYFSLFWALAFLSCSSSKSFGFQNSGVLQVNLKLYDTTSNQFLSPFLEIPQKIWYKDSLVIEEVCSVSRITDTLNITIQKIVLDHYRFNDLRTRTVYEYGSFSDTAKIIRKYSLDDDTKMYGGWNFKFKRKLEYVNPPEVLPDTLIDEINYKRYRLNMPIKNRIVVAICYFRCDIHETMFTFDPALSKMAGCPLVKTFTFSPAKDDTPTSSEIQFISDSLNEKELKILNVWENNAKSNPVK
jgi:hypothetical protein